MALTSEHHILTLVFRGGPSRRLASHVGVREALPGQNAEPLRLDVPSECIKIVHSFSGGVE